MCIKSSSGQSTSVSKFPKPGTLVRKPTKASRLLIKHFVPSWILRLQYSLTKTISQAFLSSRQKQTMCSMTGGGGKRARVVFQFRVKRKSLFTAERKKKHMELLKFKNKPLSMKGKCYLITTCLQWEEIHKTCKVWEYTHLGENTNTNVWDSEMAQGGKD